MDRQDIRRGNDRVEVKDLDPGSLEARATHIVDLGDAADHPHPPRDAETADRRADVPRSDDAEHLVLEERPGQLMLSPPALADLAVRLGDPAGDRQDQAECELRDRSRTRTWNAQEPEAGRCKVVEVEVVES